MKRTIYKLSRGSKARPNAPALRAGSPLRGAGVRIPSSALITKVQLLSESSKQRISVSRRLNPDLVLEYEHLAAEGICKRRQEKCLYQLKKIAHKPRKGYTFTFQTMNFTPPSVLPIPAGIYLALCLALGQAYNQGRCLQ